MRNLAFVVAFLAFRSLMAQDLHVYYNAHSDSLYYLQNGRPISRPQVRKGQDVILHIENFNNYLYRVTVKTERSSQSQMPVKGLDPGSFSQAEGFDPLSLIFGATGGAGGIGIPGLSLGDDKSGFAGDTKAEQEQQALFKELRQLEATFRKTQEVLNVLDDDMSNVQKKMKASVETRQIQALASDAIGRIKYNPQLEPRQIKALSLEYMAHIFGDADPKKLGLAELLHKTDADESWTGLRQEYAQTLNLYAGKLEVLKLNSFALQQPKFNFESLELDPFRAATQKFVSNAEKNLQTYRANAVMLDTVLNGVKKLDLNTLLELHTDYIVLKENDFSHVSRHKADGDKLDFRIAFTPVDSVKISGVATKQVAPIEVIVYGGLQIKGGIGLSFGGYFERPGEYFVRDSFIQSSSKETFSPILTSFVHFYSQSRGGASFGGSFGVGIPIGGGSGLESLTFLLGPSLIVGRNQGVVLSAGLMGGKVNQLSGGYAVGDRFDADAGLLPTKSAYQLGYFLGVSFNLIGK